MYRKYRNFRNYTYLSCHLVDVLRSKVLLNHWVLGSKRLIIGSPYRVLFRVMKLRCTIQLIFDFFCGPRLKYIFEFSIVFNIQIYIQLYNKQNLTSYTIYIYEFVTIGMLSIKYRFWFNFRYQISWLGCRYNCNNYYGSLFWNISK